MFGFGRQKRNEEVLNAQAAYRVALAKYRLKRAAYEAAAVGPERDRREPELLGAFRCACEAYATLASLMGAAPGKLPTAPDPPALPDMPDPPEFP